MLNGGKAMFRSNRLTNCSVSGSLDSLPDEELVSLCEENSAAVSVLISRYVKLIWKKSYFYSGNYLDSEDLTQEGLLALLKAAGTFDKTRNAKFSSYCDVCITNRMKNAAAKSRNIIEDVTESDCVDEEDNITPELICLEKESVSEIYEKISSLLSEKEWEVFKLYLDDMSYNEISEKLGISFKSVDNAVFRVKKKLRALLSPNHFAS